MTSIAVCLASFNRRETTLRCLHGLFSAALPEGVEIEVYLLDDASPDGTAAAVAATYPQVRLLHGDGQRFWAGGMRAAFGQALSAGHDAYLWLNDDVVLEADAIARALAALTQTGGRDLVVGSTYDPDTRATTYGGRRTGAGLAAWRFSLISPEDRPIEADTVNGNFVLISSAAARRLGNISEGFAHGGGDFDYGLRARKAGIRCWVMPGYAGQCGANLRPQRWADPSLPVTERLRLLEHPLGYPVRLRLAYFGRHFPLWAPLMVVKPYLDILATSLRRRLGAPRSGMHDA
ncbi:MAG: glycosyltransferase family 2 protein [Caulobacteraceae bacterium]